MQQDPITTEEMQVAELNAQYLGINHGMLMQAAGREVSRVIIDCEKIVGARVVAVCGGGGNGGDGMVAARHLHEAGAKVEVLLVGGSRGITSPDAKFNWYILQNLSGVKITELRTESAVSSCSAFKEASIIIDALLGFGLRSPIREPIATAIQMINDSSARKYSIDLPTGIHSETGEVLNTAVVADVTITLHAPKHGLLKATDHVGDLVVVPIGIPPEAYTICGDGDLWLFNRPRSLQSKKGDFGRILVVGGSDVFSGAPALAGMAAYRSGADLVSVVAPEPVVSAIRSYSPNLMVASTGTKILSPEAVDVVLHHTRKSDVVILGPGLGRADETRSAVKSILDDLVSNHHNIVLDADGLKLVAGSGIKFGPEHTVLTPHWGELGIIIGHDIGDSHDLDNRISQAIEAARLYDATILLKGATDIIARPDGKFKLNKTGCPAMTVGGTGDVLTGITAAFLARGKGAFAAASAAAFVSGLAGEAAFEKLGDHIVATDCIEEIPLVMHAESK
ncbi:MAG: NAD(P)H-hydrate dehydratase [Candidatus Thorarchaeota archaeon]|nr:NAD(P)H-hydrate dehydratase [Candidatus Thorarchaeota archaeon]